MLKRIIRFSLCLLVCGLLFHRCGKSPTEPERLAYDAYPPQPTQLNIATGDRLVHLTWQRIEQVTIQCYYIYRSDTTTINRLIDSTTTTSYIDRNVQNGRIYSYQVSAKSLKGYEGPPSEIIAGRPGFYALTINSGAAQTRSRAVTLTMVAPSGTVYSLISNDSTFTDAGWESFGTQKSWDLSPGDGSKKVYAKFRGQDGSEMDGMISDEIILDTDAVIDSIDFNYQDQPFQAGKLLKVRVYASEPHGTATMDIGGQFTALHLYDDGSHGDETANDAIYTLHWLIPNGLEILNGLLTANFIDAIGNTARSATAERRLTIKNLPQSVTLFEPIPYGNTHDRLYLSWTSFSGTGFVDYRIYRHTTEMVDYNSTLVGILSTATVCTLVDSNLTENTTYYYRVYVTDALGFSAGSNLVAGKTAANLPPAAVHGELSYLQSQQAVLLSWGKSSERDFGSYRIFRSLQANVNSNSSLLAVITDRSQVTFTDEKLSDKTTYWYAIYVYDISGQSARSNVVTITTSTLTAPKPVLLAAPSAFAGQALRLSWTQSTDDHFQSYRIYRSKTSRVDSTATPITVLNSATITSYDDLGLDANTTYYYRTFVYDSFGHFSGSNTVFGKTLP